MENKITGYSLRFVMFNFFFIFSITGNHGFEIKNCSAQYTKYWIQLTDKNNNPYTVSNPSAFLSARSIQRRLNQNISIVQNDLPITPLYYDSIRSVSGVTVLNRSKWFNAVTIFATDTNALNTIKKFSLWQIQNRFSGITAARE